MRSKGLPSRMGSTVGLFAHVSVASRDMVLSSGVSLLRHSYLCGTLVRCEEGLLSLRMTDRLPLGSG